MQRAATVEADVVGDVDQRIDRPEPHGGEPLLDPGRRPRIIDAAKVATGKTRTGVGRRGWKSKLDLDWTGEVAVDAGDGRLGLEPAPSRRGKVAGDAAPSPAIGAGGGPVSPDPPAGRGPAHPQAPPRPA